MALVEEHGVSNSDPVTACADDGARVFEIVGALSIDCYCYEAKQRHLNESMDSMDLTHLTLVIAKLLMKMMLPLLLVANC